MDSFVLLEFMTIYGSTLVLCISKHGVIAEAVSHLSSFRKAQHVVEIEIQGRIVLKAMLLSRTVLPY